MHRDWQIFSRRYRYPPPGVSYRAAIDEETLYDYFSWEAVMPRAVLLQFNLNHCSYVSHWQRETLDLYEHRSIIVRRHSGLVMCWNSEASDHWCQGDPGTLLTQRHHSSPTPGITTAASHLYCTQCQITKMLMEGLEKKKFPPQGGAGRQS